MKLQSTTNNTIDIENMSDVKEKESRYDLDTTVKCGNKVKSLQAKLENIANTIIKDQKRKGLENVEVIIFLLRLRHVLRDEANDGRSPMRARQATL